MKALMPVLFLLGWMAFLLVFAGVVLGVFTVADALDNALGRP